MAEHHQPLPPMSLGEPADAEVVYYRAVSKLAVIGLVLGLLSPVALVDPAFWLVPVAGIVLSAVALWQTADPAAALAGRKAALSGLLLSLALAAAAPTDWLLYRRHLAVEARQFADMWFDYVREGEAQKAHQLVLPPAFRRRFDARLGEFYREHSNQAAAFKAFVERSPVRELLAAGDKAEVRYQKVLEQGHFDEDGGRHWVKLAYVVTCEENGEPREWGIDVVMSRVSMKDGRANWKLDGIDTDRTERNLPWEPR